MSDLLTPFYGAWRAKIGAAWPEVLPGAGGGGIWDGLDLGRIPFSDPAVAQLAPYAALDIDVTASLDWGIATSVYECRVTVYYISRVGTLDMEAHLAKVQVLKDAVWGAGVAELTAGQVISEPWVSCSMTLPANTFLMLGLMPFRAAAVISPCVVGEG